MSGLYIIREGKNVVSLTPDELKNIFVFNKNRDILRFYRLSNNLFELAQQVKLEEIISIKQREQNLIKLIISTFRKEQEMLGSISARDMFLLLRMTDNSPSLEEILNVFYLLSTKEIDILEIDKKEPAVENTTYTMKNTKGTVNRLRMIANAIEKGLDI